MSHPPRVRSRSGSRSVGRVVSNQSDDEEATQQRKPQQQKQSQQHQQLPPAPQPNVEVAEAHLQDVQDDMEELAHSVEEIRQAVENDKFELHQLNQRFANLWRRTADYEEGEANWKQRYQDLMSEYQTTLERARAESLGQLTAMSGTHQELADKMSILHTNLQQSNTEKHQLFNQTQTLKVQVESCRKELQATKTKLLALAEEYNAILKQNQLLQAQRDPSGTEIAIGINSVGNYILNPAGKSQSEIITELLTKLNEQKQILQSNALALEANNDTIQLKNNKIIYLETQIKRYSHEYKVLCELITHYEDILYQNKFISLYSEYNLNNHTNKLFAEDGDEDDETGDDEDADLFDDDEESTTKGKKNKSKKTKATTTTTTTTRKSSRISTKNQKVGEPKQVTPTKPAKKDVTEEKKKPGRPKKVVADEKKKPARRGRKPKNAMTDSSAEEEEEEDIDEDDEEDNQDEDDVDEGGENDDESAFDLDEEELDEDGVYDEEFIQALEMEFENDMKAKENEFLAEKKKMQAAHTADVNQYKKQIKSLQDDITTLQDENLTLKLQNTQVLNDIKMLETKLESLQQQYNQLNQQYNIIQTEYEQVNDKYQAKCDEFDALLPIRAKLIEQLQKYERILDQEERRLGIDGVYSTLDPIVQGDMSNQCLINANNIPNFDVIISQQNNQLGIKPFYATKDEEQSRDEELYKHQTFLASVHNSLQQQVRDAQITTDLMLLDGQQLLEQQEQQQNQKLSIRRKSQMMKDGHEAIETHQEAHTEVSKIGSNTQITKTVTTVTEEYVLDDNTNNNDNNTTTQQQKQPSSSSSSWFGGFFNIFSANSQQQQQPQQQQPTQVDTQQQTVAYQPHQQQGKKRKRVHEEDQQQQQQQEENMIDTMNDEEEEEQQQIKPKQQRLKVKRDKSYVGTYVDDDLFGDDDVAKADEILENDTDEDDLIPAQLITYPDQQDANAITTTTTTTTTTTSSSTIINKPKKNNNKRQKGNNQQAQIILDEDNDEIELPRRNDDLEEEDDYEDYNNNTGNNNDNDLVQLTFDPNNAFDDIARQQQEFNNTMFDGSSDKRQRRLTRAQQRRAEQDSAASMNIQQQQQQFKKQQIVVSNPSTLMSGIDELGQYIKLVNGGNAEINLANWSLFTHGRQFKFLFPEGAIIPPNGTFMLRTLTDEDSENTFEPDDDNVITIYVKHALWGPNDDKCTLYNDHGKEKASVRIYHQEIPTAQQNGCNIM